MYIRESFYTTKELMCVSFVNKNKLETSRKKETRLKNGFSQIGQWRFS